MSEWANDITNMHDHYGIYDKVHAMDGATLQRLYDFRGLTLQEEVNEFKSAKTAEDAVDALVDLIVFAIGTLDLFDIDSDMAWNSVHRANMAKEVGIKHSRPNPFGLPDLIKPEGWVAPSHAENHGKFTRVFDGTR